MLSYFIRSFILIHFMVWVFSFSFGQTEGDAADWNDMEGWEMVEVSDDLELKHLNRLRSLDIDSFTLQMLWNRHSSGRAAMTIERSELIKFTNADDFLNIDDSLSTPISFIQIPGKAGHVKGGSTSTNFQKHGSTLEQESEHPVVIFLGNEFSPLNFRIVLKENRFRSAMRLNEFQGKGLEWLPLSEWLMVDKSHDPEKYRLELVFSKEEIESAVGMADGLSTHPELKILLGFELWED